MKLALCVFSAGVLFAQQTEVIKMRTAAPMEAQAHVTTTGSALSWTIEDKLFQHKLVKGAPYSAETITESVQILSDGNRIVNKQSGKSYRDGEGRTRRDQEIKSIGPWTAGGEAMSFITIDDPIAKEHITLNPKDRTATRIKLGGDGAGFTETFDFVVSPGASAGAASGIIREKVATEVHTSTHSSAGTVVFHSANGEAKTMTISKPEVRKESLGKTTMEGVEVEGTRETMTIAAGTMGNERAIDVVTERWYSPALQIEVLRKHKDPRSGETTYRTTAIRRAEPDKSLFAVPSDYKVNESKPGVRVMRRSSGGAPEIF